MQNATCHEQLSRQSLAYVLGDKIVDNGKENRVEKKVTLVKLYSSQFVVVKEVGFEQVDLKEEYDDLEHISIGGG